MEKEEKKKEKMIKRGEKKVRKIRSNKNCK
jgi:hypothetical protein